MVVVARENGIDIHCDDSGKFSAFAYGQRIEDRALSKVKKWTAEVKPTVTLMEVDPKSDYGRARGFYMHDNVVEVQLDANGVVYGSAPTKPSSRSRYTYAQTFRNLYEPDEAAQARIKALNGELRQWEQEMRERYEAAFAEIVTTLVPITPERFEELLQAKAKENVKP